VEKGYRQMASMLITFGADVNARDGRGNTPLHCCNTRACCKLLMKYDIDATIKNNEHLLVRKIPSISYTYLHCFDDKTCTVLTLPLLFHHHHHHRHHRRRHHYHYYHHNDRPPNFIGSTPMKMTKLPKFEPF
jgi:hypothetical protein